MGWKSLKKATICRNRSWDIIQVFETIKQLKEGDRIHKLT